MKNKSGMSSDLKAFLIAGPIVLISFISFAANCSKESEARRIEEQKAEQAEMATYRALPVEQKIRKNIKGITEFNYGETVDGVEALQLTIQYDLVGLFGTLNELTGRAAGDIKDIYAVAPNLQTLDIEYHVELVNAYGETSYGPALYLIIDRPSVDRIQWQNFNHKNLPKVCTEWTPLRNLND